MNSDIGQALSDVAQAALETTAFMFVVGEDDPDATDLQDATTAAVPFSGPIAGTLLVSAEPSMLPELAGNMLGLCEDDDPPTRDHQLDAFKELANVICGNLLPCIAGREAVFDVGAPRMLGRVETDSITQQQIRAAQIHLDLDAGWAHLAVYLAEASKSEAVA